MAMSCCSRAAWAGRGRAWRGLEGPGGAWKGSGLVTPGACTQQGLGGWRGRFLAGRDGPGVQLGGSGPREILQAWQKPLPLEKDRQALVSSPQ